MQYHKYSLTELEDMIPFEREVYVAMLIKYLEEEKQRLDPKCWKGKKIGNPKTKMKGGVRVNNCVPAESVNEAGSAAQQAAIAISMKKAGKKPKNEN